MSVTGKASVAGMIVLSLINEGVALIAPASCKEVLFWSEEGATELSARMVVALCAVLCHVSLVWPMEPASGLLIDGSGKVLATVSIGVMVETVECPWSVQGLRT
ncbi:hypothetical protein [Endozoicomonas sp. YOMI1]|uniref:hypothetical protein n=1 Tax=Endozoicomonas sp. YOMI1 TaxID=2828739 RepID=UPI0021480B39|nr:hypothetical protein [Endozoicomonas sp. YOMI1]